VQVKTQHHFSFVPITVIPTFTKPALALTWGRLEHTF